MNNHTAAIEVRHLKRSFKKLNVLRDVSFTVEQGTIFALLGSNGAGKTTIINILSTLLPKDSGSITINGFDAVKHPEKVRRAISLTGQFAAVDDILSARENLVLIAELRHVANANQAATDLLAQFDLADAADRRVQTFSGGMRRRLDIAMSLIGNPSIIFLDEPTTGLDPQARNDMWQTIKKLARNGTTILLTTQYLEEADKLADVVALLHKGTIVASGSAQELKQLVPSDSIELLFQTEQQLQDAVAALGSTYTLTRGDDNLLTVVNAKGIKTLTDIFTRLRDAHIEPLSLSQRTATLDDVFFKIITDKKEDK